MLLLDGKPFSFTLVGARTRKSNHLACGVEGGPASFLEGLLEACSAFHAFELEHISGQGLASGSPKCVHNKGRKPTGTPVRSGLLVSSPVSFENVESALLASLEAVYGSRARGVLESLGHMGDRYYFRLNSLVSDPGDTLDRIRSKGIEAELDDRVEGACFLPVRETPVLQKGD